MSDHIPTARRATCEFCPEPVDIGAEGTHQYTTGWVMLREGGGGHGVSLPKREPRWAHKHCIERETNGPGQRNLSL